MCTDDSRAGLFRDGQKNKFKDYKGIWHAREKKLKESDMKVTCRHERNTRKDIHKKHA
jgi:hypothetical protein